MGMRDRIAARLGYEKRAGDDPSWSALAPAIGYPARVSARAAENLSTVLACVHAISTALAYVPALVYSRASDRHRTAATAHPPGSIVRCAANAPITLPSSLMHCLQ